MAKRKKNNHFTLFEVLIVIALISLALGSIGMYIPRAFRVEHFEKSASKLLSKLITAQEVMVDYNADVTLHLHQAEKTVTCQFTTSSEVPTKIVTKLNREPSIEGIDELFFNHQCAEDLTLKFISSQGVITEGVLTLKGEKEVSFVIPEYPSRIVRNSLYAPKKKSLQALYPPLPSA